MMTEALWPPKPKLFDMQAVTRRARVVGSGTVGRAAAVAGRR